MKPCLIKALNYFRPLGDCDYPWQIGRLYRSEEGEFALLCDSEEHANRILAALKELDAHTLGRK